MPRNPISNIPIFRAVTSLLLSCHVICFKGYNLDNFHRPLLSSPHLFSPKTHCEQTSRFFFRHEPLSSLSLPYSRLSSLLKIYKFLIDESPISGCDPPRKTDPQIGSFVWFSSGAEVATGCQPQPGEMTGEPASTLLSICRRSSPLESIASPPLFRAKLIAR